MVLRKLDSNMQKNETGPLSYTIYKNKMKMGGKVPNSFYDVSITLIPKQDKDPTK